MSRRSRARRIGYKVALVAGGLALIAGCTSSSPDPPPTDTPPPPPRANALPGDCTRTILDSGTAPTALDQAKPGDKVCFTGTELGDADLKMHVSGTADKPISLIADGTTVRSINVTADHVLVDGFTISDGAGLDLQGTGLTARNNVVRNATDDGIVCANCHDAVLELNTVWRTDGTGIVLDGDRSVMRYNTVSESVMRAKGDADGVRFFGSRLWLVGNTIRDIKATGYPEGRAPHTDCFQTYLTDTRPTYDVLIADNTCTNVDVQCLIATGGNAQAAVPPGFPAITFENNNCTVYGSQGVLLEDYPNVVVRNNQFAGPQYRAVFLSRGAVNCTVTGNTVAGNIPVFEIDDVSRPGFHAEGNIP